MALINDEDIKVRAYYLSEDDGKLNKQRLSNEQYYCMAQDISKFMKEYYFFEDSDELNYSACKICFDYYAKVHCVCCRQSICVRCMMKMELCPFCRNVKKKKHYFKKRYTSY
jgi:hypothetical protein